jgi:UDP-N-acetylglucosamine--N-acetylmuramyl-(pentapeptide) pyrophosphoryl-undecaprenol N-acetylglucosamine transferase
MKLCITGGGTGGHLMIAEALVEAAVKNGHEVIFIGSTSGQDQKYFAKHSNFSHVYFLETTGVVNQKKFGKLKAIFKVLKGVLKARNILKKHNIEALYSVGGFSAAPASFASIALKIPLFIHEQNAVRGKLNDILRPFAKSFISAYEQDSPIKGYPVKEVFYQNARVRDELKTIIFLGGSQGAKAINDLALNIAKDIDKKGIKIIHQAGEADFERVKSAYISMGIEAEVYGFTKDLPTLMSKADLAVSRSGASTLWELTANGLPAFYIPYPYAAGDHQYHNAKFIVDNNLGWCMRQGENLEDELLQIIQTDLIGKSQGLLEYATRDVASKMIKHVKEEIEK